WVLAVPVRVKIMGIALCMVGILGLVVTVQVRSSMRGTLEKELQQRGSAIARDVAGRATDLILTNNLFALHELLRTTREHNEDIRYLLVLDGAGEILSHTLAANPSPQLLMANNLPAPRENAQIQPLETDEGRIYDVALPIFGGRAGVVRVGMSERRMEDIVGAMTRRLLGVTALVSLGGIAAALLLTFVLTRPILTLRKVAQAVERGEFSEKAPVWSRDEIGQLSQAINAMTEALDRSRRQVLRTNEELSALNAISVTVSRSLDLGEILEGALAKVLEMMGLRGARIFLNTEGQSVLAAHAGSPPGTSEQPAYASVPLQAKERVLGTMEVITDETSPLGEEDLKLLSAIGHQIGLAVENARLYEEVQRKEEIRRQLLDKLITAQEEERKRIARELHDEAGQALTSILLGLKLIDSASDTREAHHQSASLRALTVETLEALHDLALELRPSALDELGLAAALERYVKDFGAKHRLGVDFQVHGFDGGRLPPSMETTLYRIAQEALTNVARHAGAANVSVLVERRGDSAILIVEDDGRGFDVERALRRGRDEGSLGLFGMRERAVLIDGIVTIESQPSGGSTILVKVPLFSAGEEQNGQNPSPPRG
ncbi:MAG TPA: HAMP domain-containing protein, partial [Thermoleophilia bacterium]|nr:HAMP domain-containing protein [Thermoleophilia bacterium]